MNTESIPAKRVEPGTLKEPGDFCWSDDFGHLYIMLPGHHWVDAIPVRLGDQHPTERVWGWNGNKDCPSLTPSILSHAAGKSPGWHGYLTNGRLASC